MARRPNGVHFVLALAIAAAAFVAASAWLGVVPDGQSVVSDDGVYAIQAKTYAATGSWQTPYSLAASDDAGAGYPYGGLQEGANGRVLSPRHVPWSWMHAVASRAGLGSHVLPLFGYAGAVLGSYLLSRSVGNEPKVGVLAAVLTAASPLLFQALQLWAHAMTAAAFCFAMVLALPRRHSWSPLHALALAGAVVCASALRADGFLFSLALGFSLVLDARGQAPASVRRIRVLQGGVVLAASVLTFLALAQFVRGLAGRGAAVGSVTPRQGWLPWRRLLGVPQTFLSAIRDDVPAFLALLVSCALVAGGAVLVRRTAGSRVGWALVVLAAAPWFWRIEFHPRSAATGLFGAWPVAFLIAVRRRAQWSNGERWGGLVVLVGSCFVALTQSEFGGGLNWGGRLLSCAAPMVAVLLAKAVHSTYTHSPRPLYVAAFASVLVVTLLVAGLVFDVRSRKRHEFVFDRLGGAPAGLYVVTGNPDLPLLDWARYGSRRWLTVPSRSEGGVLALAHALRCAGEEHFVAFAVEERDVAPAGKLGDALGKRPGVASESGRIGVGQASTYLDRPVIVTLSPLIGTC